MMMGTVLSLIETGLFILAATAAWRVYARTRRISQSFQNIPGPPSTGKWVTGHISDFFHRQAGHAIQRQFESKYGQVVKLDGMFGTPLLFVFDPLALHNIVIKDQQIFEETHQFLALNSVVFGQGLVSTSGEHHRKQRKLLTPAFSTHNLRHILPIFYEVTERMRSALAAETKDNPKTVDILSWMTRAALEMVGQGGLGYTMDPLTSNVSNPFADAMKSLGPTVYPMFVSRTLLPYLLKIGSPRFRRWVVEWFPYWRVQKMRRTVDTLHTVSCEIFKAKRDAWEKGEEAVVQQMCAGKDIVSKLLQANMKASEEDKLPDEEVIAQISTLVLAAMETTSGALSRILHLLAEHPKVQSRLRDDISAMLQENHGKAPSYDQLHQLPFLDAVCRETLRLYPPGEVILKTARKDVVLPLGTPVCGRDGKLIHEVFVPQDATLMVGILASNRNPALWGVDADQWRPERWLSPLPEAVIEARIPGTYANLMTFLGGGRGCIGFKFSQMEMKVVLFILLQHFKFSIPTDIEAPIVWNIVHGLTYPTVGYENSKAQLPLRLERI